MGLGLVDTLIPLKNGPAVPASVITWLLSAEDRGVKFRADRDGGLRVGPPDAVTQDDRAFIAAHRDVIRECVAYVDDLLRRPL